MEGQLIMAGFNALIVIAKVAIEKAAALRAAAIRSREWTPEEEAEADARIKEIQAGDHWMIDPDPTTTQPTV